MRTVIDGAVLAVTVLLLPKQSAQALKRKARFFSKGKLKIRISFGGTVKITR